MKRPASVTIIIILVLLTGGFNIIRLVQSIKNWEFLVQLLPFSPLYFILSGLIWIILSLIILFGIKQRKSWTLLVFIGAVAGYSIFFWVDRLLLAVVDSRIGNDIFVLILNSILLGIILSIISRGNVRDYFGVTHE